MQRITYLLALLSFSLLVVPSGAGAEPGKGAAKDGWWIRIRSDKQEADSVVIQVGTQKKNREQFKTWKKGETTEFDLPAKFRNEPTIYIHATSNPNDKNTWFCVMYKTRGVKHMDFDDDEDHTLKTGDSDDECNF
jgi:hypothetical protein